MIDIIVPIYNAQATLTACVKSLLSQEDKEGYCIYLIDDGSSDRSGEMGDDFQKRYDNIQCFHQPNGGIVSARRMGIEKSSGEYIVFVDADDFVDSLYITNIKQAIQHKAEYYILNNKKNFVRKNGFYKEKNFIQTGYVTKNQVYQWLYRGINNAVWDKIFLRKIITDYDISFSLPISHGDDFYINLMYIKHIDKAYVQDTDSYVHIVDSVTSVSSHDKTMKRIMDLQKIYEIAMKNKPNCISDDDAYLFQRSILGAYINAIALMDRNSVKDIPRDLLVVLDSFEPGNIKDYMYKFLILHKMVIPIKMVYSLHRLKTQ